MEDIKYINERQFLNDFSNKLRESLENYYIQSYRRVGNKELDLYIENPVTGSTYSVEVKGSLSESSFPPEIIPWMENYKTMIDNPKNHFILFTLSGMSDNTKSLFNESGLEVFEYKKHRSNLTDDFIKFIKELEKSSK